MEEIKDKAFEDEFNKAEDTIERKRDTTPVPRRNRKTEDDEEKENEDEYEER